VCLPHRLFVHLTLLLIFKCSSQELKLHQSLLTPEHPEGPSQDGSKNLVVTLVNSTQILETVTEPVLAQWTSDLENILDQHGGGVNLRRTSARKIMINVTGQDLKGLSKATKAAATWLAKQNQVSWVEEATRLTVKKTRGTASPAANEERIASKAHGAPALHHDKQLRNQNAVVTAQGGPGGTARLHQVFVPRCKRRTREEF
jgi:hypothetical protein